MIEVYNKNFNEVWFGLACTEQRIFSTSFDENQTKVSDNLLNSLPFNMPFQVFLEPSAFAKNVLSSLKSIFDGKNVEKNFL